MSYLKIVGLGLAAGVIGILLVQVGEHLWADHVFLHQLQAILAANQQAAQQQQQHAPPAK